VAGLPTDRFRFEGFLPARRAARLRRLRELSDVSCTLVFYEAVHRIRDVLDDMQKVFGPDRRAAVARELTKRHETLYRGTLSDIAAQLAADPGGRKGEFTLIVGGSPAVAGPGRDELERVLRVLTAELPARQAARLAARLTGATGKEAYRLAILLRDPA